MPEPPDVADAPRQVIEQAARDIKRGLRDTERRGLPSDVPGPGSSPEETQGAAVPENGIDPECPGRGRRPGSGGLPNERAWREDSPIPDGNPDGNRDGSPEAEG